MSFSLSKRTPAIVAGLILSLQISAAWAQGAGLPLSLEHFVAEVAAAHPSVVARQFDAGEAEAGVDAARSQYLPTPSIQVDHRFDSKQVTTLLLSQPLWAAGRIDANLDAAQARKRSADNAVTETQLALALRTVDLCQQYLVSRGRQAALQAGADRLRDLVSMMERRFESGISAEVDRELGRARQAQARSDLMSEQSSGVAVLSQLSQLVGRPIDAKVFGDGWHKPDEPEDEVTLIQRAQSEHPAMQRAGAEIEAAQFEANRQRAMVWPTLLLQAEHKVDERYTPRSNKSVFLLLQYQGGAGLSAFAAARGAALRTEGLRRAQESTQRDIVENLRLDFERYRAARDRLPEVQRNVGASREILESYQRLFIAGKRAWLDVVNAARELTQAELTQAEIDAALAMTPYRLKLRAGDLTWIQQ